MARRHTQTRVISFVRGTISPEARQEVAERFSAALASGLPPAIEQTYLLTGDGDAVAILTVWRDRAALETMMASGEEPFARRLIREAGGQPMVEFLDVAVASGG